MPEDKTNKRPNDGDIKGPTPPENPVEFARWVQRPRVTPKNPEVQPDDSAMRLEPMEKPEINRAIGTDKPKRVKRKNPNVTRTPQYLRQQKGLKTAPVAKAEGLIKFLQWFDENGAEINIQKMSPTTLAAFGLGWYISDSLTRDEKQKWQRQLDDEFNRSVERLEASNRMSRSGKKIKKSAFHELQEYYPGLMR
jgi:hypothetical protein